MTFGGLLAGGSGTRMETALIPKQFLKVGGIPVFIRPLKTFLSVEQIDKVIISMNVEWEEEYKRLLDEFGVDVSRVDLIAGSDSRFKSMINIVNRANEISGKDESIIVTHDCARIFVTKRIIEDTISAMREYDMVTTSLPTIDTILQSDDGKCCSIVPDRSRLWNDQGPQAFEVKRFLKYVSMIPTYDIPNYIEAGKVYLSHNQRVGIVKGDRFNFKITNDIDLQYAEFLIQQGIIC